MKKKVLLAISSTLSLGLMATVLGFNLSNSSRVDRLKSNTEYKFDFDGSSIQKIADKSYSASLKSESGAKVDFDFVGASYNSGIFTVDNEFYLVNKDPISGFSRVDIDMLTNNSGDSYFSVYFSYNQLTWDNILDGKYEDIYSVHVTDTSYSRLYELTTSDIPDLVNYRYVLVHVTKTRGSASFANLSFTTVCDSEIPGSEIGVNEGYYTSEEKDFLCEKSANSVTKTSLVNAGNKTYHIDTSSSHFNYYQFTSKGDTLPFFNYLEESGFENTYEVISETNYNIAYQKQIGGDVHSVMITGYFLPFSNFFELDYMSDIPYLKKITTWPKDEIDSLFIHAGDVVAFESPLIDSYIPVKYEFSTEIQYAIVVNPIEGKTRFDLKDATDAYINAYIAKGYAPYYGYSDYVALRSPDSLFAVIVANGDEMGVQIVFEETIVNMAPPTASQIATAIDAEGYESLLVPVSGGEGAYYSNLQSNGYKIFNFASNAISTIDATLLSAGWENYFAYDSGSYSQYEYMKMVDACGSYLHVSIDKNESSSNRYINVSYQYIEYEVGEEYSSLSLLLSQVSGLTEEDRAALVAGIDDSNYNYVKSTSSFNGATIGNAGSELATHLAAMSDVEYNSYFDVYILNGHIAITLYQFSDGVFMKFDTASIYDYSFYNMQISQVRQDNSLPEEDCIYLQDSDAPLGVFTSDEYGSTIYAASTESEVNRIKQILIDRIESTERFTYSTYLDQYINKSTGTAYKFTVSHDSYTKFLGKSVYQLKIDFASGRTFTDYASYNESGLSTNAILALFPEINFDKDAKVIAGLSISENAVTFESTLSAESYITLFEEADFDCFSYSDYNEYFKVLSDGSFIMFTSGDLGNGKYVWRFDKPFTFVGITDFRTSLLAGQIELLESFDFFDYFVSENLSYYSMPTYMGSSVASVATCYIYNASEIAAFEDHLLLDGYSKTEKIQYGAPTTSYTKEDSLTHRTYRVVIGKYSDKFAQVEFRVTGPLNWSEVAANAFDRGHDIEVLDEFIAYPSELSGYVFEINYIWSNELGLKINSSYITGEFLDDYHVKLINHPHFVSFDKDTSTGTAVYTFDEGVVGISNRGDYYYIKVIINHVFPYDGDSIDNAITAVVGNNEYQNNKSGPTYYAFTPSESGTYAIESFGSNDPVLTVYDGTGENQIGYCDDYDGRNFYLTIDLEAGETYYLCITTYSSGSAITNFTITLNS